MTKGYIIIGWSENKDQISQEMRTYWMFWDDKAGVDGIIMKGRHVIIPKILKTQTLDQLNGDHMGIEKAKLLACNSVYWVNINGDIENHMKNCATYLTLQQTPAKDKMAHNDIPTRPWEIIGAHMFTLNNKHYFLHCRLSYQILHHLENKGLISK